MQISVSVKVGPSPNTQPKYQLWYLGSNNIGAEGCIYLSQSKWNNLQILNLGISYAI